MNKVAEMIRRLQFDEPDDIGDVKHYGIKRRSGRYPWGSGENRCTKY